VAHFMASRSVLLTAVLALVAPMAALPAADAVGTRTQPAAHGRFTPGAPGVGDPYFPRDGNGGYDVRRYLLDLRYAPSTGLLSGVATIRAHATQDLSRFNLDLDGLQVGSVRVNGRRAAWSRHAGELTVDPRGPGLRQGRPFRTVVRYAGHPRLFESQSLGAGGFFRTDDGALVAGQPHSASSWFPVNDHPRDRAAYTFRVTAPKDLQVVANGTLTRRRTHGALRTWTWRSGRPMASYLATIDIGHFALSHHRTRGIRYVDAIDSRLLQRTVPRTGRRFALTQRADSGYKRLTHTIDVPAGGATLSFWVTRNTEPDWDFFFVEAHTPGADDWTTLPDANGHTRSDTGASCPAWLELHPFLGHYQTQRPDGSCSPRGTTGTWEAVSGRSDGYEHWVVDLSAYAGRTVEVSLAQASDDLVQIQGAFVDDVTVSTGQGTTSFEEDGDTYDGWTVSGPPPGSPGNTNDWTSGTAAQAPAPEGVIARRTFRRQPEILRFLSTRFGRYPLRVAGGIVDREDRIAFALETQTRPVYASTFFGGDLDYSASVVVHELAHQWYGDSLTVRRWRDIWLNEGFATYAEWMWSAHEHLSTPQRTFTDLYDNIPADDPSWKLRIGNPGPDHLFDGAVYQRGAMTLHVLRLRVGDHDFFRILRRWARTRAGHSVTTPEFIRLAEHVSGQHLRRLFHTWLFTAHKPRVPGMAASRGRQAPRPGGFPRFGRSTRPW